MKSYNKRYLRTLSILVLTTGLVFTACKNNSVSSNQEDEIESTSQTGLNPVNTVASSTVNSSNNSIIIDSFDEGAQSVVGYYQGASDSYSGPGPIGNARELLGWEGHPVTTTFSISGTSPGENRISGGGASYQELRYGSCVGIDEEGDYKRFLYNVYQKCTNSENDLNRDFSSVESFDIDFVNLLAEGNDASWKVHITIYSSTYGRFSYTRHTLPYQEGPFTYSIEIDRLVKTSGTVLTSEYLEDVDGIVLSMTNNGNTTGNWDIAVSEFRAVGSADTEVMVYKSEAGIQTYDPIIDFDPDTPGQQGYTVDEWVNQVCHEQTPRFGLDANWVNPHDAYKVADHPYIADTEALQFEADWIHAIDDPQSSATGGPNDGQNWTYYHQEIQGDGEFVIQHWADNCSWVFLDDQLIGQQNNEEFSSKTPGLYSVTLEAGVTYTLSFIIFDGNGYAGGKYRLETTESYGGDVPPPIVTNTAPVADAGDDITKEATGPTTPVTLTGSGSDADGDALTYSWSTGDSGTSTTVNLGVGVHTFTLTVSDGQGASDSDEVVVEITDTTAPVISFSQETGSLWPPNHKMVLVATGISADDLVSGTTPVDVQVSSNEPSNGRGDGNTDSDYEIVTNSDGTMDVYVRAERSGKNSGRTYTITMSTVDAAGNGSSESFEVQVAKSQGRGR